MNYHIEHPELSKALYLALNKDPYFKYIESTIDGDASQKKQGMQAYMDYSIIESQKFGECFIPEKQHYGVSVWSKPIDKEQAEQKKTAKEQFIASYLGENCLQAFKKIAAQMTKNQQDLIVEENWYLSIIGIKPDFQGQGLGPGLVEDVLAKTDQLGVSTYLETYTTRNHTFYQRLGYQDCGRFYEPTVQADYWLMQRPV